MYWYIIGLIFQWFWVGLAGYFCLKMVCDVNTVKRMAIQIISVKC